LKKRGNLWRKKFRGGAPTSLARKIAAAKKEAAKTSLPVGRQGRAKIPGGRSLSNPLPCLRCKRRGRQTFCPPERPIWRVPARRSLGIDGKRAVSSVLCRASRGRIGRQNS